MTAYARGATKERRLAERLTVAGWVVYRAAGSHGLADLVALRKGFVPMLIQVKSDASHPFAHFGRAERHELMVEARLAGAIAVLAWMPPRRPIEFRAAPKWEPIELEL
jgi:Holliday junction resolvase